jgi:serine/threonine protein kinase
MAGEQLHLLEAMLDLDPNTRPTAAAALDAPYFDALPSKPPVTLPRAREEVDATAQHSTAQHVPAQHSIA